MMLRLFVRLLCRAQSNPDYLPLLSAVAERIARGPHATEESDSLRR